MKHKKQKTTKKVILPYGSVLFFLFLLIIDASYRTGLTFLAAFLHEVGHCVTAKMLGVGVEKITVYPFGADMVLSSPLRSYKKDVIIAAAGAGVNLLLAWGTWVSGGNSFFVVCNLSLAVMNLMPIRGLDGGTVLFALCSRLFSPWHAERAVKLTSFVCLFVLWIGAVYVLLVLQGDPSLFVIVCALFVSIFLPRQEGNRYWGKTEETKE